MTKKKMCSICKQIKIIDCFGKDRHWHRSYCKECGKKKYHGINKNRDWDTYLKEYQKKCNKCNNIKYGYEFYRDKSRSDGLATTCQSCQYENDKKRYKQNRGRYKETITKHNIQVRADCNALKQSIKVSGCSICGFKKYMSALEFHHTDPSIKERNISSICSIRILKDELAKCIIVCSNCHRGIHENLINISTPTLSKLKHRDGNAHKQKNILYQLVR